MDLAQLALFVEVYRAGGFAPVARDRGVAPSSVSRAIATLEAQLGARLFQRTTRALTPTQAGDAFHARLAPLMEELEAACEAARQSAQAPSGRLRVTASASYGQIVLAPLLAGFRRRCPGVTLDLVLSDARVDLVEARIDVAIRHGELTESSLGARKLHDVRYRLVASPAYLAARGGVLSRPGDLEAHDVLAFPYADFRARWRFWRDGAEEEAAIRPAATVSNAAALAACARAGLGVALLADWTIAEDLRDGRLIEALPGWSVGGAGSAEAAVWIVLPSRRHTPAKTRAFVDWLAPAVRELLAAGPSVTQA